MRRRTLRDRIVRGRVWASNRARGRERSSGDPCNRGRSASSICASASLVQAAATPSRRCHSKPTLPASWPAKRRATARRPRSKRWPSPVRTFALGQSRSPPRRRVRPLRRDALPGRANGDGGDDPGRQATAGQVLTRNGAIASVYYSASCGGRTEIPSNVWPGADDPPYLPSSRRRCVRRRAGVGGGARRGRSVARVPRGRLSRRPIPRDAHRLAKQLGTRRPSQPRRSDAAGNFRPGPPRRRRTHARLAAHQEHSRSSCADREPRGTRGRLSIQRPRVRARRRPVRHRSDQPRCARRRRARHPGEILSRR